MNAPTLASLLAPYRVGAVADGIGVDRKTVYRWRSGATTPDTDSVIALATFLRVEPAVVLAAITAQKQVAA